MEVEIVLLGQNLRRRHDGRLVPAFHHMETGQEGNDRLSAPHISLDQPVHGMGSLHILLDLCQNPLLGTGQSKGEMIQ